ncbi:MAG: hypothetical protein Q8P58_00775 [Candidatus Adlerbacteria bacterium]|nr:hypothetical protein [Candidatus Adlerbacteria bacterium]
MNIMVLIHGRHLETGAWEKMVWGDPKNGIFGQAASGVRLALKVNASVIYWGSGASERDGMKESQYAFAYTVAHGGDLSEFNGSGSYQIESMLRGKSFFDLTAQNTEQEIEGALKKCHERGIECLYLVSAPTHISRCMLLAAQLREQGKADDIDIYASMSDVPYVGYSAEDVVVIEPPQRGDAPKWQTFRYVQAMLGIMRGSETVFTDFLTDLGKLLQKYGVHVNWVPRQ